MGVDPDDWSLGRGWLIALRIMGMRALLILAGWGLMQVGRG